MPDIFRASKFRVSLNPANRGEAVPVRAVYFLRWGKLAVHKLDGLSAIRQLLLASPYRQFWSGSVIEATEYARRCTDFLTKVPAWDLTRPQDAAAMDATLRSLYEHWNKTAL